MKLLKYVFYFVLFVAIYQFVDSIYTGKIHPMDKIKSMSDQLTQMTEKMVHSTYQSTMVKFDNNVDQAVDNGEDIFKQMINE